MRFEAVKASDKLGRSVLLRNAEVSDAEDLIQYLKITAEETPFLIREPDEIQLTVEQEACFIKDCIENPRGLMLSAFIDGRHIGTGSMMSIGTGRRYSHRCEVSIALYQQYCGAGIGEIMLQKLLSAAVWAGYEQAELEVVCENKGAAALYQKLGFKIYGNLPHNMKYSNGKYADAYWMVKYLVC